MHGNFVHSVHSVPIYDSFTSCMHTARMYSHFKETQSFTLILEKGGPSRASILGATGQKETPAKTLHGVKT